MSGNNKTINWSNFYERISNNDLTSLAEYGKKLDRDRTISLLLSENIVNNTFIYMLQNEYVDVDAFYKECSRIHSKDHLTIYVLNNFNVNDNDIRNSVFYMSENLITSIYNRLDFNDTINKLVARGHPELMEAYMSNVIPPIDTNINKLVEDNYKIRDTTLLPLIRNNNINLSGVEDNVLKDMIKRESYRNILSQRIPLKVNPMIEKLRFSMGKKYGDNNYQLNGDYLYV